jgi:sporulation integral membrane protein YlbJ
VKKSRYPVILLAAIFMAAIIVRPDRYMASVLSGLKIFTFSVLPALFPFFFFTKVLTSLGVAHTLGAGIEKPLAKLYNAPPVIGYIMVMSMLCGYPTGAKLVSDCYKSGLIDLDDVQFAAAYCSTGGPIFILGTIGSVALGDKMIGAVILLSHYTAALLNGFVFRRKTANKNRSLIRAQLSPQSDNLLHECVYESIFGVLLVGGYIALFGLITDILIDIKAERAFLSAVGLVGVAPNMAKALFSAFFEMTKGSFMLAALELSRAAKAALLTGIISFGGMCVGLQSLAFLSKCGVSPLKYFTAKASQAVIGIIVALLLGLILL